MNRFTNFTKLGKMFTRAGQPEILRSAQRDDAFQKQLSDLTSEVLRSGLGVQKWIRYKETCKVLSHLVYNMITTLSNIQTLGEEYTGMMHVSQDGNSLPSRHVRLMMILLKVCGESVITKFLNHFEEHINQLPPDHPILPSARIQLVKASSTIRNSIPYIQHLHRATFYTFGNYYHISKQVTGIRYVLVRHWLKDRASLPTFKLLGAISFIHVALYSILGLIKLHRSNYETGKVKYKVQRKSETSESCDKCPLCLNGRENASVASCGHMFCWSCIIPWLQEQPQCPICRQTVHPSWIVLLQNYT